jgi:hypothetical protein
MPRFLSLQRDNSTKSEVVRQIEGYGLQPVKCSADSKGLYMLQKDSGFVSGHDFSRAVN